MNRGYKVCTCGVPDAPAPPPDPALEGGSIWGVILTKYGLELFKYVKNLICKVLFRSEGREKHHSQESKVLANQDSPKSSSVSKSKKSPTLGVKLDLTNC
jgi:hypothetical protein